MSILSGKKIQKSIEKCQPSKIAVAFIGSDWGSYLQYPDLIESIIISPTLGSNPYAIQDIVNKIGWSRVYFLDSLHAKIYVGNDRAVVGSANLTKNGLNGERLFEISVEITEEKELLSLNEEFESIIKKSNVSYPTVNSKKIKLNYLFDIWHKAVASGVVTEGDVDLRDFSNFELLSNDQFYVTYYKPAESEYSKEVEIIKSVIANDAHFLKDDDVEPNKWVLMWRITSEGKPHMTAKPEWLFIHDVFENGVIDDDYEYTTLAIERSDRESPTPPFELTKEVIIALKESVVKNELSQYFIQNYEVDGFYLNHAKKGLPDLIRSMKLIMKNKCI